MTPKHKTKGDDQNENRKHISNKPMQQRKRHNNVRNKTKPTIHRLHSHKPKIPNTRTNRNHTKMKIKTILKRGWFIYDQYITDSKDNDDINTWFLNLNINKKRRIHKENEKK